jgi:hypothetical protein
MSQLKMMQAAQVRRTGMPYQQPPMISHASQKVAAAEKALAMATAFANSGDTDSAMTHVRYGLAFVARVDGYLGIRTRLEAFAECYGIPELV